MSERKILVVGQGIAGTCIAWQLLKKNIAVTVVDAGLEHSSSVVAAGLYNPIVFKRFTHSWKAQELIEYLDVFYAELEVLLGETFHSKHHIIKVFTNVEEKKLWIKKSQSDGFMIPEVDENYFKDQLKPNHGIAHVVGGGAIDLKILLGAFRKYLVKNQQLISEKFDFDFLNIETDEVSYRGEKYSSVIFCEGSAALQNPYFPQVAFKLTHGETLEISVKHLPKEDVINKGAFLLPKGNDVYKVGATYRWDDVDGKTSQEGLHELKSKLDSILEVAYEVLTHEAGIRPTVVDRRPVLGSSSNHKQLYFFNGMGTKGVMLAPYFSEQLVDHVLHGTLLAEEVDIARYYGVSQRIV